jgi:predicted AAA+ superfamily ATPase
MPEIVNALNEGYNKNRFSQIYSGLINGYNDDLHKFELRNSSIKYLEHILMHAPKYAGHSVNYAGFGDSGYGSRELAQAFSVLESVMLLTLARASSGEALPWIGQEKKQKKLIFLDIGLANYISGLQIDQIMRKDLNELYRGKSAEQVVGQQLLSDQRYNRGNLHYWVKDYREGGAEVDFCTNVNGYPVGIEVKSGSAGSLKSLFEFSKKVPDSKLLRIYSGKMIQSIHSGISVKSIPFYLLPRYGELV